MTKTTILPSFLFLVVATFVGATNAVEPGLRGSQADDDHDATTTRKLQTTQRNPIVFATSERYTGDLGGTYGADQKCQILAGRAGLPGRYTAWVADLIHEVFIEDRIRWHNDRVPYELPDGTVVANSWTDFLSGGSLVNPINRDETGAPVDDGNAWTFANNGEDDDCLGWTTNANAFGSSVSTALAGEDWFIPRVSSHCSFRQRLFCLQSEGRPATVFVSSQEYNGDLGGLFGADDKCQTLADAAGLDGTYLAWLSNGNDSSAPANRFSVDDTGSFLLPDGTTVVAYSWDDLLDGSLNHAIDMDENGNTLVARGISTHDVWTGIDANGLRGDGGHPDIDECNGWTSGSISDRGDVGRAEAGVTMETFTNVHYSHPCSWRNRIYCFEQNFQRGY